MPADKARFVGEPVAMVVAETIAQAKDAAELVEVDYELLPAVVAGRRRGRARRAAALGRGARQSVHRCRGRRRGGDRRRLRRAPRMSCGSTPGSSASPACRWSRAPRIAEYDRGERALHALCRHRRRRRQARSDLAQRARRAGRAGARDRAATWAAISARATSSIPNMRCSPGRRSGSAGRSNGPCERSEAFLSDYQGRDLDGRGRAGARRGRQVPRACAAPTSAISAPTPRPSCRCRRGSG